MMKKFAFLLFSITLALIAVGWLTRPAAQAATAKVSCREGNFTVRTGQTFYVTLVVTDTQDLYAWQFDAAFNPQYLEFVTMLPGNHLRSDGAQHFVVPPVVVNVGSTTKEARYAAATRLSKNTGVNGSGQLAHVMFKALEQKTDGTTIDLKNIILADRNALEIAKDYVNSADCKVTIRDNAPVFTQPPVGELIFLPAVIR
ncbi:MAG: cohesin domain-containing protein [Anaerolineales bacterium]|nr:cohesin domain-containing protein [Anaerolineales bacterium]MDW8162138.1 cohesin domain-containing protein [Anaerolineales bacterium]